MKRRTTSALFSLIAVSLLTVSTFAADRTRIAFPREPAARAPQVGTRVAIGDSREAVLMKLGAPTSQLSPNGWMYEDVEMTKDGQRRPGYAHLVLVFTNDRVSSIRVLNDQARSWLIAQAARESDSNTAAMASSH